MGETGESALRLSPAEKRAYREDGFFVREGVFAAPEIEALREAAEQAGQRALAAARRAGRRYTIDGKRFVEAAGVRIQLEHDPGTEAIRVIEPFHGLDPRFERLVDDPRLAEPMRDLVASEAIALLTAKLNFKRPGAGSRFRWHQDSPYWVFRCGHVDRCPNALLALDDADEGNGCLEVIRGSHRKGLLPGLKGEGVLGPLFTDPRCFDAHARTPVRLRAGSVLFFSPHIVHGSEPNRSPRPRRALVLTYQPGGHPLLLADAVREVARVGVDR